MPMLVLAQNKIISSKLWLNKQSHRSGKRPIQNSLITVVILGTNIATFHLILPDDPKLYFVMRT